MLKDIELYSSNCEDDAQNKLMSLFATCPIPKKEQLNNLGLFLNSKQLSRMLFFDHLYKKIIDQQGVIFDFGTRWGHNVAIFTALRGIYEPYNRHRKIVGFDTFEGFNAISDEDGKASFMKKGGLNVTDSYEIYLDKVMKCKESFEPLSHIKKYDIRKGDAVDRLCVYLKEFPATIVSLAYFDMDLYQPTKDCLELILERTPKGAILGFDELNDEDSPGETQALKEVLDLCNVSLQRYRYAARGSYIVL